MTKREAIRLFRSIACIPQGDKIMRRCAWLDFTDALCKERSITERQYDNWTNPFA